MKIMKSAFKIEIILKFPFKFQDSLSNEEAEKKL